MARFGSRVSGTIVRRALLCSLAVPFSILAQDSAPIRVNVQLVRVLATVKDPSGALVGSLGKDDFTVKDNGVLQQISVFERQTDQPLSVAILIDNSGSTAKDLKYETDSVSKFLRALLREGNPDDAVALYSFNWEIVKQIGFTRNAAQFDRSLRNLRGEAGTSLYDAVLLASRDIQDRTGRKVLVIVTDGGDTTSHSDFLRASEAAQLADAVIYPVLVVPITNEAGRNVGGENALTTFAQRTGGRVFAPSLGAALDDAFQQIIRDLRTQYLLAFYPKDVPATKERYHSLDVAVSDPRLRAQARSGYYGDALPSTPAAPSGSVALAPSDESVRTPRKQPAPKSTPTYHQ
jgi:Ca-activated chloride channel family protein